MNTEPRKLSKLLNLCLYAKTSGGLHHGMCTVAHELQYRGFISLEESEIVKAECMKLVRETRLAGRYNYVSLLSSALLQRLSGKHVDVDDLCYLIYSCWIDKLETVGK